jgi:hypothetical protein
MVDVMQIRVDFLALGGGGIIGVERTGGTFSGLWVGASEPTEPLFLFVIGKVAGPKSSAPAFPGRMRSGN